MLNENLRNLRKSKGLSQEELAVKLNVVRQTISKWEKGLSVPDSEMLITLSEVFETPVSTLLGETVDISTPDTLKVVSEKLEAINSQLAQKKRTKRSVVHYLCISLCILIVIGFVILVALESSYLGWDYSDPEIAVIGVGFHVFEWLYVRIAPFAFIGVLIGAVLTHRKKT